MISETLDINLINKFLNRFNTSIDSLGIYSHYMIYELNANVVAFLAYDLIYDRIEIEYIYVDEYYRNQGIASKMFNNLLDIGIENKCINISLEVRENNLAAIKFYKKHNFNEVAKREKYYKNENGILMVRELV